MAVWRVRVLSWRFSALVFWVSIAGGQSLALDSMPLKPNHLLAGEIHKVSVVDEDGRMTEGEYARAKSRSL